MRGGDTALQIPHDFVRLQAATLVCASLFRYSYSLLVLRFMIVSVWNAKKSAICE